MRTSLYDAIGVGNGSAAGEIRSALRALVRRFWTVPRDPSGDSEEALRFISLAAAILTDDRRRDNYDASLSPGVGAGPWRIPVASARQSAIDEPERRPSVVEESAISQLSVDIAQDVSLPSVEAFAENFPGEASRPVVWIAIASLIALVATVVGALLLARAVGHEVPVAAGIALIALVLAGILGANTAQRARQHEGGQSLSNLAVIKWRRDGSVFIGVPPPQQDTAWLFRLRVAELTRSTNGYLVQSLPWRRFLARAFDYSLLALALFSAVAVIQMLLPEYLPDHWLRLLRSPLILPTGVVLAAIPIEAMLTARFRMTPGKWLLGLLALSGVTHAGPRLGVDVRRAARRRSLLVARNGLAFGFLPLTVLRIPIAWQRIRGDEPDWDAESDTVVLARPVAWLPATTSVLMVLATALVVLSFWLHDGVKIWHSAREVTPHLALRQPASAGHEVRSAPATESAPAPPPTATIASPTAPKSPATAPEPPQSVQRSSEPAALAVPAAAAQSRRARIERAQAAVAAVKRGQGTYGPLQGLCQRWTEDQPGSADAWRCLGLAKFQNGEGTAALPALRNALRLEPRDPEVERAILTILRPQ